MNMLNWIFLVIAIASESIATNSLKASNGFTNLVPSIIALVGYGSVLFFLSLAIRTIPVGIAYQFDAYDKYAVSIINGNRRLRRRETVFLRDCEKAFLLGKKLAVN